MPNTTLFTFSAPANPPNMPLPNQEPPSHPTTYNFDCPYPQPLQPSNLEKEACIVHSIVQDAEKQIHSLSTQLQETRSALAHLEARSRYQSSAHSKLIQDHHALQRVYDEVESQAMNADSRLLENETTLQTLSAECEFARWMVSHSERRAALQQRRHSRLERAYAALREEYKEMEARASSAETRLAQQNIGIRDGMPIATSADEEPMRKYRSPGFSFDAFTSEPKESPPFEISQGIKDFFTNPVSHSNNDFDFDEFRPRELSGLKARVPFLPEWPQLKEDNGDQSPLPSGSKGINKIALKEDVERLQKCWREFRLGINAGPSNPQSKDATTVAIPFPESPAPKPLDSPEEAENADASSSLNVEDDMWDCASMAHELEDLLVPLHDQPRSLDQELRDAALSSGDEDEVNSVSAQEGSFA